MANKIQVKRGVKANLPTLSVGEPAFTTDTNQFYVGNGTTNIELAKATDLSQKVNNDVTLSEKNLPSTFNNDLNNITETGIYRFVMNCVTQHEPINGTTDLRRVTLEVINHGGGVVFQRITYNSYASYTGQKFERIINESWINALTNASIKWKTVVVSGDGTNKVKILLDGMPLKKEVFAINSNTYANSSFVVGTNKINSDLDVEVTLNQNNSGAIQLTVLYFV